MWLIKYFSFSVLKLAVCHQSGGNRLDWVSKLMDWVGVGLANFDPRTTLL